MVSICKRIYKWIGKICGSPLMKCLDTVSLSLIFVFLSLYISFNLQHVIGKSSPKSNMAKLTDELAGI